MKKFTGSLLLVLGLMSLPSIARAAATMADVLGSSVVTMDATKAAQVRGGVAGQRWYYDTNSDGKPEECWFLDIDPRHSSTCLVKVVDTSGNLAVGKEPSHADAIYICDTTGDNLADHAIIYEDYDHDGDMDAMAEYAGSEWWWSIDDGDDNCLWYDRNYTYDQNTCQDHCGFGADESFFALSFNSSTHVFTPYYEAPFLFWDNNHDGRGDEVMRIAITDASHPTSVYSLRWGMNPTGYGTAEDPRHYICSISAHPVANMTIASQEFGDV